MSPSAARLVSVGDTATESGTCCTVTAVVPEADPDAAVIVAAPFPTAVTSPNASTSATASSLDSQRNSAPATACPFASSASAVSRIVSPSAERLASPGNTSTALTS